MDNTTSPKRGRKPVQFSFPAGEFKVKELAAEQKVSVPLVHLKMKEAGQRIKLVRKEKTGRKGRSSGVYQYTA